jgi:Ca2+-binding RTX toxin-like protein
MHRHTWTRRAAPLVVAVAVAASASPAPAGEIDGCSFHAQLRSVTIRLTPRWGSTEISTRGVDDEIRVNPSIGPSPDCDGATLEDVDQLTVTGSDDDDQIGLPGWPGVASEVRLGRGRHDSIVLGAIEPDMVVIGHLASTSTSTVRFSGLESLQIDEPEGLDASEAASGLPIEVSSGSGRLIGGPSDDRMFGGSGPDRLVGGPGNDLLDGGAGDDEIRGGPGRDIARAFCACGELGDGADHLVGGADADTLSYAYREPSDQTVTGVVIRSDGTPCSGADVNDDGDACDPVDERDAVETFEAFVGGWASDTMYGMPGIDETFVPVWGSDEIIGNVGDREALDVSELDRRDGVSVDLVAGTAGGERGIVSFSPVDSFVRLIGSSGADAFTDEGSIGRVYLTGTGGDLVVAGGGDDRIRAGSQPDEVRAGAGNDRLIGDDGDDRLLGGSGDDVVAGGHGWDRCRAEVGRGCEWLHR